MLPDLSENLSNEERTWEEIMQIKAMPVCMSQKIQLKNQLQVFWNSYLFYMIQLTYNYI